MVKTVNFMLHVFYHWKYWRLPVWWWSEVVRPPNLPITMIKFERNTKTNTCQLLKRTGGLPWWLSGRESTCQCRRHRFDPWSRKSPHAVEQLSTCPRAWEPQLLSLRALEPVPYNEKPPQWEARAPRLESSPHMLQLKKEPAQQWRPSTTDK